MSECAAALIVSVAGNPNSGKSCLFNALTGTNQTVGNYPGVTVEKKEGTVEFEGRTVRLIDLPGTYSLTAFSQDEVVARNSIITEKPDVVINVVDASNLERNLYLTAQLLEMRVPMVVALNMADVAAKRGYRIHTKRLARLLGVPVVKTVGKTGKGTEGLLREAINVANGKVPSTPRAIDYGPFLEEEIRALQQSFSDVPHDTRWLAVKLLEEDELVAADIQEHHAHCRGVLAEAERRRARIAAELEEDACTLVAEQRYGFAAGAVRESVDLAGPAGQTVTDMVDAIVCNRVLGFGFVALCMYLLFKATFLLADDIPWIPIWTDGLAWTTPVGAFDRFFGSWLPACLEGMSPGPLRSLVLDGVVGGVGGVMSFVPLIFFMFFLLAVVEDSGYIARVAFVMDRILRAFGLQGKSILALIVSGGIAGGCAVPGILATRTLREERDRLTTMLVAPFMNCGAKMPVHMLLIAAFFANRRGEMLWLLAILSWIVALGAAFVLRRTLIVGEPTPFVMELPAYHVPHLKGTLLSALRRTWLYMRKAGTIILAASIVLWALLYFPRADTAGVAPEQQATRQLETSAAGRLGQALEPVSRWAGFNWRTNIALIGGFAAKEVVLSTLGTAYSLGEETAADDDGGNPLVRRLRREWTALQAFALMVFVTLYAPCVVTVATIWRESGRLAWALFATAYSTTIAFALSAAIYQAGLALQAAGG